MTRKLMLVSGLMAFIVPAIARAQAIPEQGGFTSIQSCLVGPTNPSWLHWDARVGFANEANATAISPSSWTAYAEGTNSAACENQFAIAALGPGSRNQDVFITGFLPTDFWDWSTEGTCGHQHISFYVFGWRDGQGWFFVDSYGRSTNWDSVARVCRMEGANYPPEFTWGTNPIRITDRSIKYLAILAQGFSHGGAPCGTFGCYHPVKVVAGYR